MSVDGVSKASKRALAPLLNRRVIVVDDEPAVLALVCRMLRGSGAIVLEAADAETAWRLVLDESPDLLVTDVDLPRESGHDLARRVRERCAALPVLLMTGGPSVGAGHADAILRKPFAPDELIDVAASLLRHRSRDSH